MKNNELTYRISLSLSFVKNGSLVTSQQFGMNKYFFSTVLKTFLSVWGAVFSSVCFLRILQQVNVISSFA